MSNRELPMMPWYPDQFAASCATMTFAERAAYRALLDVQWALGVLPADNSRLARAIGMTEGDFGMVWPGIASKFPRVEGGIQNFRLEQHRVTALKRKQNQRQAAAATNAQRSANRDANRTANRQHKTQIQAAPTGTPLTPTPTPTPSIREEPPPPTDVGAIKPKAARRLNGSHPRAEAANPRAAGTNPRATGSSPRARRQAEKSASPVPIGTVIADASRWAPLVKRGRLAGFRAAEDGETADGYEAALSQHERMQQATGYRSGQMP